jgi:hypothetical protein
MSYVNKTEDFYYWPAHMAAKTRREDAQLLAQFGPLLASDQSSAALLWALAAKWPTDKFDEINVGVEAPYNRAMKRAVEGVIGLVRTRQSGGGLRLSARNERDLLRWFLSIIGRPIDGLVLVRDPIGWCDVLPAGRWGRA